MSFVQPCIALVVEGGIIQNVIVQGIPEGVPMPHFVLVDFDVEGTDLSERIQFDIGTTREEAICGDILPEVYQESKPGETLSPSAVRLLIQRARVGQDARQQIVRLIHAVKDLERQPGDPGPTADDFEALRMLVIERSTALLAGMEIQTG